MNVLSPDCELYIVHLSLALADLIPTIDEENRGRILYKRKAAIIDN